MTRRMTYIGRRCPAKGGKLVHAFLKEGVTDQETFTYWPKAKAHCFAGAIIGTTYDIPDDTLPTGWSACAVGEVDEQTKVRWQASDRLANTLYQEERVAKNRTPELDEAMETLRLARLSLPPNQRAAFDAMVLNSLR